MESSERFALDQRIIEEFASRTLGGISSELGRLLYVARLRDVSSGRYRHPLLEETYPESAVHQALLYCHEELFERFLESELEHQERDLRNFLADMDGPPDEIAARWLEVEFFRLLVPFGMPAYLRDLFHSNLRLLFGLIVAERAMPQPVA